MPPVQAATSLGDAVRTLRAAGAEVVVASAPDLSVVPWVPPQTRMLVRAASAAMRQAQTRAAVDAGARVPDIEVGSADVFAVDASLFSADRFHPSSAGYAVIAESLAPAVRAAAAAAPAGRAFPGIHIQDDTFAELRCRLNRPTATPSARVVRG
ncbi:GDSL-type esterase/lipase family protein [Actinoplanes sp. NPDC048791]|uniref:GDSL-type esterase/lipase family protein n=1 Tax=Actinoplanes sp. NPDC048791 TaxID=3154623 RepID=UPI0033DA2A50